MSNQQHSWRVVKFVFFLRERLVWMTIVSMVTILDLCDYLKVTQLWWNYPPIYSLLGYHQILMRIFWGRKRFWTKMIFFPYFGSILAIQTNFGKSHKENFYHYQKPTREVRLCWYKIFTQLIMKKILHTPCPHPHPYPPSYFKLSWKCLNLLVY